MYTFDEDSEEWRYGDVREVVDGRPKMGHPASLFWDEVEHFGAVLPTAAAAPAPAAAAAAAAEGDGGSTSGEEGGELPDAPLTGSDSD